MDGVILINKEKGISSFGVVSKVRKILNIKKVGHSGTLDPNATGVLPILVGNATKASKYLIEHDKTYIAKMKLGLKTTTADIEGDIIKRDNFRLKKENLDNYEKIFNSFIGKSKQIPPMYSAIKVNGKKLYDYAREGKTVKLEPRDIEIYSIKILNIDYEKNEIEFEVYCSKGTYIRTLCEDIATSMGTVAFMKELNRTKVDKFKIEKSITLSELEKNKNNTDFLKKNVISIEEIFCDLDEINLSSRKKELFLNGVKLTFDLKNGLYKIYEKKESDSDNNISDNNENENNMFIGLGVVQDKLLKRDIII